MEPSVRSSEAQGAYFTSSSSVLNQRGSDQHTTSSQTSPFKEINHVARASEIARILPPGPMTAGSVVFQGRQPALARMQPSNPEVIDTVYNSLLLWQYD